ncbi:heterokaryon incompatibility protein-domain-containing protein [Xylaria bambusicola]|uniref:heterokaryon incompatibility protein-domain-containing protein n=1 Tax=Xylaria bambusicola TaxID=326684 RepID=UPI002007DBBA|nr:heterokaryon incompatibility protein-domain-containing protein [Xylaria bambusicola]KAI0512989.1 heterokaryon incompatibility protein-domain-containing protein [Xylaria bambusicola]
MILAGLIVSSIADHQTPHSAPHTCPSSFRALTPLQHKSRNSKSFKEYDTSQDRISASMWLINVESMKLEEFTPPDLPTYAILSHTWEDNEVTFREFKKRKYDKNKAGFVKIKKTCQLAAAKSIKYVWVDTCCIDKSSSAELSEAINSMFDWYRLSAVCFTYLSDLPASSILVCRWFTRGWTLQELLAPDILEFYDREWNFRGRKTESVVMQQLSTMTGIHNMEVFRNRDAIRKTVVGERMSWVSKRQTKRLEDIAYCLLGIFQVNMPMLYGEGMRAFQRLQEEIIKSSTDMSLFCWRGTENEFLCRGILAHSPAEFATYHETSQNLRDNYDQTYSSYLKGSLPEFSVTNKGVRIEADVSLGSYK